MIRPAVWGELGRALVDLCLVPPRAAYYLARRRGLEREARADLACASSVDEPPPMASLPERPLRAFVSCAEASGEIHAANLVRELRRLAGELGGPAPEISGLGGPELAKLGVEIVGDPVSRAAMGFDAVASLPFYAGLLADAAEHLRARRPDVFLPVDSPALHVPLARLARRAGARVVHFVTPQYWGWAPWRVAAYRRTVDLALCILPFEVPWFERHGVPAVHVGHPLLDELAGVPAREPSETRRLALLPGSRRHVVRRNLPWMLSVLAELRESEPTLEVVLPHGDPALAPLLDELVREARAASWVRIATGGLHEELARASSAFSVSGTVLLDLLHHRLPAVVVYRLANARQTFAYRHFLTSPWFASVNLLANAEAYPEFCFHGDGPREAVRAALARSRADEGWRAGCRDRLEVAARRLGPPGAVRRAAGHALALACATVGGGTRPRSATLGGRRLA